MSESLVIRFQYELSSVMETVFKTAIHEITDLVKNVLIEEMVRSQLEVKTLKRELQVRNQCSQCAARRSSHDIGTDEAYVHTGGHNNVEEPRNSADRVARQRSRQSHSTAQDCAFALREETLPGGRRNSVSQVDVSGVDHDADVKVFEGAYVADDSTAQSVSTLPEDEEYARDFEDPSIKLESDLDTYPIKEEGMVTPTWCHQEGSSFQDSRGLWERVEKQIGPKVSSRCTMEDKGVTCCRTRKNTFSVVAKEVLKQFHVWQNASYSRHIEWGPITAKIVSALPHLSGRRADVIVRCNKMLQNRRDYLRRRAKEASLMESHLQASLFDGSAEVDETHGMPMTPAEDIQRESPPLDAIACPRDGLDQNDNNFLSVPDTQETSGSPSSSRLSPLLSAKTSSEGMSQTSFEQPMSL
ncbi:uncharacterized protein LOC115823771 [Chanos chanos]|uniref:Uncharacterized protein LOC115823771 n=1 Tax=Chanos chanos TaxID=29144 RepID=A0A6J2WH85_CHACN|nr:uncharacterized protein LOC115823771 [Chanos chanos]